MYQKHVNKCAAKAMIKISASMPLYCCTNSRFSYFAIIRLIRANRSIFERRKSRSDLMALRLARFDAESPELPEDSNASAMYWTGMQLTCKEEE